MIHVSAEMEQDNEGVHRLLSIERHEGQCCSLTGLSLCRLRVTEATESKTTDEEELLGSCDVGSPMKAVNIIG